MFPMEGRSHTKQEDKGEEMVLSIENNCISTISLEVMSSHDSSYYMTVVDLSCLEMRKDDV